MNVTAMNKAVDAAFAGMLARLSCKDGTDAYSISHWQGNGFRLQVTRKDDGARLTKFVSQAGTTHA